jgi:phosphoinositide-3-kinase regulatory subunit 4
LENEADIVALSDEEKIAKNGNGLTIIVSLVCSCLNHIPYTVHKLTALELMLIFSTYLDDEVRLNRLLPYFVSVLSDPAPTVRAMSVHALSITLSMVRTFPISESHIFLEYILPALSRFPTDQEELVRLSYAQNIASLAESARRFLDIAQMARMKAQLPATIQSLASHPSGEHGSPTYNEAMTVPMHAIAENSYDTEFSTLADTILKVVIDLLTLGGSRAKRALLSDITRLCLFFGRKRVNNELLPHLITVLNDRDWRLRVAFFQHIVGVSVFVGRAAFQNFIWPCIDQALFDVQEFVIQRALDALAQLAKVGLFDKSTILEIASKVSPLLCHPSSWLRTQTITLIIALSDALGIAKSHCFLLPILAPYLK